MNEFSFTDNDAQISSSCSLSDEDISLPPELLEREKQLMEKNQQLEQRVKDILKQSVDSEEPISKKVRAKKQGKPLSTMTSDLSTDNGNFFISDNTDNNNNNDNNDNFVIDDDNVSNNNNINLNKNNNQILPKARPSPTNNNIIEVEVPINVEPVPEVRYDPVPELRSAFHKIAEEIQSLNSQIAEIESNKSKCEVVISKLQGELKKSQIENDRAYHESQELIAQIDANREKVQKLKSDINSARLTKIDHVQRQNEAKQKQAVLEKKIRRQKIAAERLQSQINSMQTTEMRAAKIGCDKAKLQAQIDQEKKAVRQLKLLLAEIQRASSHEEKIFDHLQSAKNIPLTSETVERALSQLL